MSIGNLADELRFRLFTPRLRHYRDVLFEFLSRRRVMIIMTVAPASILFVVLNVLPIAWAFYASVFNVPLFNTQWTWVGIDNYVDVFSDSAFWGSLWRGAIFTGASLVIQLFLGVGFAFLINRSIRGKSIVRGIALMPYLVPTAIIGFIALWMNNSTHGITNQLLYQLGLIDEFVAWYGDQQLAMFSVVLTFSWKYTIFVTLLVLAQLQSIPDSFYEAAAVSGATGFDKFRDITLPYLKGVLFIVILLRGVWSFNKFDIIWVLTKGGPGVVTQTLPVYGFNAAFINYRLGVAAAISVIMYLMIVVAAIVYFIVLEPAQEVRVE